MKSPTNRVLMAYRPLHLRGLLLDGQYRLPPAPAADPAKPVTPPPRRLLLAALTGLLHHAPFAHRSKP
ncbi:hypothetical protein ASG87_12905 [Frateuria sp. Soil773]|uniref:hypothetical protein n=1 Tax=Frateuria sp. Soil773 TaxID=1736407 RepID=UPI0006FE3C04|nr:hypothetical protein [Frateuria sp. Soil773]KRF00582.1 hypothetical protein ASG87_12905 [Frateuria sp. Soil773]